MRYGWLACGSNAMVVAGRASRVGREISQRLSLEESIYSRWFDGL